MSYHIINIDTNSCRLTCHHGQLEYTDGLSPPKCLPLEDIGAVVLCAFEATLSSNLLIEMAKHRIGFVLCEHYKPAALLLPADRATDTTLLRHLADMPTMLRKRLWEKTLDAKCSNQAILAESWNPRHENLPELKRLAQSAKSSREAECARLFWGIFADTWTTSSFRRDRKGEGVNPLFNYAYAILLSCILQYLFALGIDPSLGLFHRPREHAAPLAYDLMEPFRSAFEANVARWVEQDKLQTTDDSPIGAITKNYRQHIAKTLLAEVTYHDKQMTLRQAIEAVCRTFRQAVLQQKSGPYQPWKISTIKWAGS